MAVAAAGDDYECNKLFLFIYIVNPQLPVFPGITMCNKAGLLETDLRLIR